MSWKKNYIWSPETQDIIIEKAFPDHASLVLLKNTSKTDTNNVYPFEIWHLGLKDVPIILDAFNNVSSATNDFHKKFNKMLLGYPQNQINIMNEQILSSFEDKILMALYSSGHAANLQQAWDIYAIFKKVIKEFHFQ